MKVATVRYVGRKSDHTIRGPSGEQYNVPARSKDRAVTVEDPEDARHFEERRNYETEWTGRGRLAAVGTDVLDRGYQTKRSLAAKLDLSYDGQPSEDELDESIEEYIETMENQR